MCHLSPGRVSVGNACITSSKEGVSVVAETSWMRSTFGLILKSERDLARQGREIIE